VPQAPLSQAALVMQGVPAGAPELDAPDEELVDDDEDDPLVDDPVDDDEDAPLVEEAVDALLEALLDELVLVVEVVVVAPPLPPLAPLPPSEQVPSKRQSEAVSAHPLV
jgi:hypothetical protein